MRRHLLSIALLSLSPAVAHAGDIGFVLDVKAGWVFSVEGGAAAPVVTGQALPDGARLTPSAPDAQLTVVLLDGSRLSCPADARCGGPLKKQEEKEGVGARLVRAVRGLFSQPERYATTMSRGEELTEAVIELRGGRASLAPALAKLGAGEYRLTISPIDADGNVTGEAAAVTVAWDPAKKPVEVKLGDVGPGLHRVALESGADAWVLLAAPATYKARAAEFDAAKKVTEGWGKDVPARAVRSFLRAGLDAVARGAAK